jgi:hypothetical protein
MAQQRGKGVGPLLSTKEPYIAKKRGLTLNRFNRKERKNHR